MVKHPIQDSTFQDPLKPALSPFNRSDRVNIRGIYRAVRGAASRRVLGLVEMIVTARDVGHSLAVDHPCGGLIVAVLALLGLRQLGNGPESLSALGHPLAWVDRPNRPRSSLSVALSLVAGTCGAGVSVGVVDDRVLVQVVVPGTHRLVTVLDLRRHPMVALDRV